MPLTTRYFNNARSITFTFPSLFISEYELILTPSVARINFWRVTTSETVIISSPLTSPSVSVSVVDSVSVISVVSVGSADSVSVTSVVSVG